MATLELYPDEATATGVRDNYNHNLGKRAVVFVLPGSDILDFGGGPADRIFKDDIDPPVWVVAVE